MFDRTRLPFVALDVICVVLAGLPFAILNSRRVPFQRGVFCSDESIRYPYKEDTISYKLLAGIIVPFSVIVIILGETLSVFYNHLHSNSFIRNNYIATIYKAIGTFIFGAAASQSLTDIAKYSIGRLRPHFLAVCQPDWTRINCSLGYIENFPCQGDKAKINEGRLSFYSGHSSFSMYCMLFLANNLCNTKNLILICNIVYVPHLSAVFKKKDVFFPCSLSLVVSKIIQVYLWCSSKERNTWI
uniref:Phospholipid phosphatase 1 n=1 Tax=Pavo cristatus TaxID=9049 RepID=A0A8C9G7Z3_PAVCR